LSSPLRVECFRRKIKSLHVIAGTAIHRRSTSCWRQRWRFVGVGHHPLLVLLVRLGRAALGHCRSRSLFALTLMAAQAFLFNAVFFSYGLVLSTFHGVPERTTGIYLPPLAVSNFVGPVLLTPLFDIVGRRKMIAGTYAASRLLLSVTAAASSAYLTVQ
jgi:hypothetical protein